MYKEYEIKLNAILDKHKGVQKVDLKDLKTVEKVKKDLDKATELMEKQLKKTSKAVFDAHSDLRDLAGKYNTLVSKSSKEISAFEQAAKNLGVKVNTQKYKDAIDNFLDIKRKVSNYLT